LGKQGDAKYIGVGKTSIMNRFVKNEWTQDYNATVGLEFGSKDIEMPEFRPSKYKLQIWDTVNEYFENNGMAAHRLEQSAIDQ